MTPLSMCWILAEFCIALSALSGIPEEPRYAAARPEPDGALVRFDIPPQPMDSALVLFGRQADIQFISVDDSTGQTTRGVSGEMSREKALEALLAGTTLRYEQIRPGVFAIEHRFMEDGAPQATATRAMTEQRVKSSAQRGMGADGIESMGGGVGDFVEPTVVVTGTIIRGIRPLGPPPIRLDRSDIEETGLARVEDVMRTVPQNFGGGATEDTLRGLEAETNSAHGNALNLRALGAGATLLLFDGRRVAPGGSEGSFSDVANFPLSALEYIEILPTSASASYGSEAVGGVVNLVPRRDYAGLESQVRAGAATAGSQDEYQLGQTFGAQWSDGGAFFALEYLDRGALAADDRDLARSDLRRFGGDNFDTRSGNPGTIIDGGVTYAIPRGQDGRSLTPADLSAGTQNLYDLRTGSELLNDQRRLSTLGTLHHQLNDRIGVFADALYSRRELQAVFPGIRAVVPVTDSNPFYVSPSDTGAPILVAVSFEEDLGKLTQDVEVDAANLALGSDVHIGDAWQVNSFFGYALERQKLDQRGAVDFAALAAALADPDPATAFNPFGDGSFSSPSTLDSIRASGRLETDSALRSIDATADGPVLELGGGTAMLAVGIDHRDQTFESSIETRGASGTDTTHRSSDRRIISLFGELRLPLFGSANRRPGLARLEISAAGRYEKYSDFGDKAVPAFGLAWSPVAGVTLRGNWSESYKAPNLADLDETSNLSQIFPLMDPQAPGGGPQPMLLWFGKNADLQEETATSWTAGVDLAPRALPGLSLGLTYFDIDFNDRVQEIASAFPDLSDPRLAQFLDRNPTPEQRAEACRRSAFLGPPQDCLTAQIAALVDLRIQNIAVNRTRGIDLLAKYRFASALGDFDLGVNGTSLFEFSQLLSRSAATLDLLDTQNNPLDLRARGTLSWGYAGAGATLAVNYADSYRDVASRPARRVASWTTYDLQLRYAWDRQSDWLSNVTASLSIQNLFDEDPPFLNNSLGIGYDQENADLEGRFIRFFIRKSW